MFSNIFRIALKFSCILALMVFFVSLKPKITQARCDTRDDSVVKYSSCGSEHNCSNNLAMYNINSIDEGVNQCTSNHVGSCVEVLATTLGQTLYTAICYAKINQPSPTPASTCGTLNGSCCTQYPFCVSENLYPHNIGGACYCRTTPQAEPSPIVNPRLDIFCDGYGLNNTNEQQIKSAIGCIPSRMEKFVPWVLGFIFSIIGGIAFILLVYSFIILATSQGDPKIIQGAKETITSALGGLLFSIFSVFILRLILLGVLKLPGIG